MAPTTRVQALTALGWLLPHARHVPQGRTMQVPLSPSACSLGAESHRQGKLGAGVIQWISLAHVPSKNRVGTPLGIPLTMCHACQCFSAA